MSRLKTLVKVDNKNYTAQVLAPFVWGRPKLWGSDTGRLMSGSMHGTLVGIFPKLTVLFFPKNDDELSELCTTLDKAWQKVSVYNPVDRQMQELGTYTSDYEIKITSINPFMYEPIKVSFISKEAA